jgi:hypothetical protein
MISTQTFVMGVTAFAQIRPSLTILGGPRVALTCWPMRVGSLSESRRWLLDQAPAVRDDKEEEW